jgi:hypothetical protein
MNMNDGISLGSFEGWGARTMYKSFPVACFNPEVWISAWAASSFKGTVPGTCARFSLHQLVTISYLQESGNQFSAQVWINGIYCTDWGTTTRRLTSPPFFVSPPSLARNFPALSPWPPTHGTQHPGSVYFRAQEGHVKEFPSYPSMILRKNPCLCGQFSHLVNGVFKEIRGYAAKGTRVWGVPCDVIGSEYKGPDSGICRPVFSLSSQTWNMKLLDSEQQD